ncbi:hypothetical protein A2348_03905 [Candidatus Uhrbacteria bacterium RIFOXYB12_FULL_58_10]|uniref:Cupin type-2 domain-containing protein n=1 Tax=Candidatus Uhrbacteria bacterium RIFOXYB2_FULL_57_15 TaxID=1802422 RepID=A0A1F7W8L9_9BACT|nr:MAG: hypothetical protein A2348_03905 [Candidatus Uhrbacteria bacterium RIFOXYB12_FULL_58_10]OGL99109.1 MAG: hypothetical protein A2304_04570 [Candidatus Uhrbacteria bacterium RIFOXYB2_FULL_57_15]OGL99600.1 MAG: hypothetical protein A2501_00110 [Candidatus Uhrbacteria bacterium RIFOXYC12_FULL_57_11]
MSYQENVLDVSMKNTNFRRVLHTGEKSQLVVMNIPVGVDVGEETHAHVEQTLYFQSGSGMAILDGVETNVGPGDVVMVSPGVRHNFINLGTEPLIISTVYVPPNHIDGRIHKTKEDAVSDVEDEAFGESAV